MPKSFLFRRIYRYDFFRYCDFNAFGFSLLDPVVSAVLIAIVLSQSFSLFSVNMRAIELSGKLDQADRDIHLAIDVVREYAAKYNWCSGSGSVDISSCTVGGLTNNVVDFYYPSNSRSSSFKDKCKVDSNNQAERDEVTNALYTKFRSISETSEVNSVKITVLEMDSKEIHRFKMKFEKSIETASGSRTLTRGFYLVPPVALWCP